MVDTSGNGDANGDGRKLVILGAGIAGLAAADRLSKAGFDVTVIERSEKCGGTHRSVSIGPYTFDVGSIFYEDTAPLLRLADGLREMCPTVMRRQRRIAPSGKPLHYPIAPSELVRDAPWKVVAGVTDMLLSRLLVRADGTLAAISRKRLGGRFFRDTGLRAYITRFNHTPPEQIDELFFYHRMAFVEQSTRLKVMFKRAYRGLLSRGKSGGPKRVPLHIRPFEGYEALFTPIRQRLEAAGVRFVFGAAVAGIERRADGFAVLTSAGEHLADGVISTIPLETLHQILFGEPTGLVSLDMTTLFVSAARLDERTGNVLFNFHADGAWKRATIYSRLYPDAPTTREFFGVEVTIPQGGTHDPAQAFADFSAHLARLGLADDLKLEGSVHLDSCYPLYAPGSAALVNAAIARVRAAGIVAVGRQGRFEYLPTATLVIRRVAQELDAAGLSGQAVPQAEAHG